MEVVASQASVVCQWLSAGRSLELGHIEHAYSNFDIPARWYTFKKLWRWNPKLSKKNIEMRQLWGHERPNKSALPDSDRICQPHPFARLNLGQLSKRPATADSRRLTQKLRRIWRRSKNSCWTSGMSSRDFAMQFETSSNKKHEENQRRMANFRFLPSLPKEYMGMSQIVASTRPHRLQDRMCQSRLHQLATWSKRAAVLSPYGTNMCGWIISMCIRLYTFVLYHIIHIYNIYIIYHIEQIDSRQACFSLAHGHKPSLFLAACG